MKFTPDLTSQFFPVINYSVFVHVMTSQLPDNLQFLQSCFCLRFYLTRGKNSDGLQVNCIVADRCFLVFIPLVLQARWLVRNVAETQGWLVWLQSGSDRIPNWTNPGLFQIRFQCIWCPANVCTCMYVLFSNQI